MDEWQHMRIASLRPLGSGGGGDVFACVIRGLDGVEIEAVIKQARPGNIDSERGLIDEARTLATFDHANIIRLRDYGRRIREGIEVPFLLLDHGGVSLTQVRRSMHGCIEPGLAIFVALEVCAALEHAHDRGVIHRDIKPANVLVSHEGQVRLIDFGIAKHNNRLVDTTKNAMVKGTVAYISPEQFRSLPLDGRVDLWAVGVLLYEMLMGSPPWTADTEGSEFTWQTEIAEKILQAPLPRLPPELVPEELGIIVTKLLEKDRDKRYLTATDAIQALLRVAMVPAWTARRELGHQAKVARDASTRARSPCPRATTVPVRAEDRAPARRVVIDLPDSMELASFELGDTAPAPFERYDEVTGITDVVPIPSGWLPRRRVPKGFVLSVVSAGVALGLFLAAVVPRSGVEPAKAKARRAKAAVVLPEEATVAASARSASEGAQEPDANPQGVLVAEPVAMQHAPALPVSRASTPAAEDKATPVAAEQPAAEAQAKPVRAAKAQLTVIVIPRGSFVSVDGGKPRVAPATFFGLRPGAHVVRAGFKPREWVRRERVRLTAGENRLQVELANPFAASEP